MFYSTTRTRDRGVNKNDSLSISFANAQIVGYDGVDKRLDELDKTKKIYVMCQSGLRSYLATRILTQNGFEAYNFAGGFRLYGSIKNEELLSKQCYSCGMEK